MSADAVHSASGSERTTDLAVLRSYLATDRTLMAWIRTALSMISFGFSIGKLSEILSTVEVRGWHPRTVSVLAIAHFMVVLGTSSLLGACLNYRRRVRALRHVGLPAQGSLTLAVAFTLVMIGWFALAALATSS